MLTSGGDCQALNAAMRGVYKSIMNNATEPVEFYGFLNGYQGLMYGRFKLLTDRDFSGLMTKGGTFLGSFGTDTLLLLLQPDKSISRQRTTAIMRILAFFMRHLQINAFSCRLFFVGIIYKFIQFSYA